VSAPSRGIRVQSTEPEQRAEFKVVKRHIGHAEPKNMLQGYIIDPETGKVAAVIRHGEVFRDGKEGAKIATVLNANLYDLSGNLLGRLDGPNAIDVRTWSMPIAVRNLLQGETKHPVPFFKQKGRPESRLLLSPAGTDERRMGSARGFLDSKTGGSHNDPAH
jgi:hypothetical protein